MDQQPEPSLRDLLLLLRRGLPFAVAVAVGAAALTYVLSNRITPEYESSATLLASRPNSSLQGTFGVSLVTATVIDVTAYQAAATSGPVLTSAVRSLGIASPSANELRDFERLTSVRVENAAQSSLIHIAFKNADPVFAATAANAVAQAMLQWDTQRATQNLQTIVETLESQITALDDEIAQLDTSRAAAAAAVGAADDGDARAAADAEAAARSQYTSAREGVITLRADRTNQLNAARALITSAVGHLEVLEPATPSLEPVSPRPTRNAALAFVLGLFLVYGLVLLRDSLDTRFRGADDLVRVTGLPVLGEFPRMPNGSRLLPREASSYLRTNALFATSSSHPKVILVTSAGQNQGKTSVAASLSESFARNDYRTLLIDGDLRKPRLAEVFGLSAITARANGKLVGTTRQLLEDDADDAVPAVVRLDGAELHVLPQYEAAPSPTELLSQNFAALLQRFKPHYDVIIIDSPPMLPVADALTMAPHTTGVLFAVSVPETDRRSVAAGIALLERIGVRILGTVATSVEHSGRRGGGDGYGYGYGYGYGAPEQVPPANKPATSTK